MVRSPKRTERAREFPGVVAPDGTVYETIFNLHEFCREHGLDRANLLRVIKGKYKQSKGWTKYHNE